ncbi:ergosterol biosynthetic protein 28 homolog isoform X1 [Physella acuta]|uniref:ergosterol biosynthetic protein 28 homolog isoform X1 n=1 Tax=Physella acuta TaxID=109671 RepID=UPI0027DE34C9|nr:ergosterol biosynthetic protein 28 homolog isoform X1 [Physella acuta]
MPVSAAKSKIKPCNMSNSTPFFVNFLRIWIAFVAVMAFGNTFQCFISSSYTYERLYTVSQNNDLAVSTAFNTTQKVSDLTARLFGTWTLLSGITRLMCALFIYNKVLYHITIMSFVLALCHFSSEVFIYKTATLTAGIIAPLIVSSVSILLMVVGIFMLDEEDPRESYPDENEELAKRKKSS